jgi:hypothetical protein
MLAVKPHYVVLFGAEVWQQLQVEKVSCRAAHSRSHCMLQFDQL